MGAEGAVVAAPLVVPPRKLSKEAFLQGGGEEVSPSPTTFVSSLFAENEPYPDIKPFGSPTFPFPGEDHASMHNTMGINKASSSSDQLDRKSETAMSMNANEASAGNVKGGARYKSMMPSRLPIPSSCLTIPPGMSPAELLESPILFCTGLADPSPTTSFLASLNAPGSRLPPGSEKNCSENRNHQQDEDSFIFQPHPMLAKVGFSPLTGMGSLRRTSNQADIEAEIRAVPKSDQSLFNRIKTEELHEASEGEMMDKQAEELVQKQTGTEAMHSRHGISVGNERMSSSSDGYNWKKYGQKQLKGTERPRSYYKCTHPGCSVKKQVECSDEGEITEIIYKGEHNHPRPQTTRRGSRSNSAPSQMMVERLEQGPHLRSDLNNGGASSDIEGNNKHQADVSLSPAVVVPAEAGSRTPEQSFCSPNDADIDEEGEGKSNRGDEQSCEEDEHESKRRRMENGGELPSSSYAAPIRTFREPRVVVQTISEVDILDDGYRWRKYGQKIVKGHTHPRNYYKCTNAGCRVRKHIERSSLDPRSVKTTYEGKHNHDVPLARGRASA